MDVQTEMVRVPAGAGAMPCFVARPPSAGSLPAVLVIQEAFGLNGHIKDVAQRIAAEGYVTLAPDLYWRGGEGRTVGYDELPEAIRLMQSLQQKDVVADVGGAIAWLGKQSFVRAERIGVTGFCMGGTISYRTACEFPDEIKAAVPFYGGGIPVDQAARLKAPVLAFFGERDGFIPLEHVEALKADLQRHGKQAEVIVYPGADHGFFCNERASYQAKAAEDSWERLKTFFALHLKR